jgi:hypothetical protein
MRTSATVLAAALALVLGGCVATRSMGEDCTRSEQCMADGVCLKGVCSGYECTTGSDCSADMICGSFEGVQVCTYDCNDDQDCPGEQACTEVERSASADSTTALYCM